MAGSRMATLKSIALVYVNVALIISLVVVGTYHISPAVTPINALTEAVKNHVAVPRADQPNSFASTPFLNNSLGQQIEYELHLSSEKKTSKLVLVLFEVISLLGLCGVDRCYMGETTLGIIKGVTLGGLGIWALIDYFNIMFNALLFKDSISSMGYNAKFEDVKFAGFLAWGGLLLNCLCYCLPLCFQCLPLLLAGGAAAAREQERTDDQYHSLPAVPEREA